MKRLTEPRRSRRAGKRTRRTLTAALLCAPAALLTTGALTAPASGVNAASTQSPRTTTANATSSDAADITVTSRWDINGVTYEEDSQPDGFEANATLSGPGDTGATPQKWGEAREGYTVGDTVRIDETVQLRDDTCRLDGQHQTAVNGRPVSHPLPHTATLSQAHSVYTITNVVTCGARLTLAKEVYSDYGGTAKPDDWTLTAHGPTRVSGTSGTKAVTDRVVDPGTYTLSEDDGPSGYQTTEYQCSHADGTPVPVRDNRVTLSRDSDVTCTVTSRDTGRQGSQPPSATAPPAGAQLSSTDGDAPLWLGGATVAMVVSAGGLLLLWRQSGRARRR